MFTTYRQQTLISEEAPVRDGQSQETKKDLAILDTSGPKCSELSERTNQESSFMKMLEEEFQQDFSTAYVTTWKVRVTKQRLSYSLLTYSVRRTKDTANSLLGYWPTPSYTDNLERQPSPTPVVTSTGSVRHQAENGSQSFMRLNQVVKL